MQHWTYQSSSPFPLASCTRPSDFVSQRGTCFTSYLDHGHLFLIYEDDTSVTVLRHPAEALPYKHVIKPDALPATSQVRLEPGETVSLSPGFPNSYGMVGISVRTPVSIPSEEDRTILPEVFVLRTNPDDVQAPVLLSSSLRLAAPVLCDPVRAESLTSVRATCSLYMLADSDSNKCRIQLVRYGLLDDTSQEHIIELDAESGVDSSKVTGMTSDDYMGVMYLTTTDGSLFVCRFA